MFGKYHSAFLDGPVIQSAYHRALQGGHAFDRALRAVEHAARCRPTVVMSYWEPVKEHGPERLARGFADAGAAGVMVVDLPHESAASWRQIAAGVGLTTPRLVPREATDRQLQSISSSASGWLYAPANPAPTGYRGHLNLRNLSTAVRRLRATSPLPIVSGVGISTPDRAVAVAPLVDAIVIGTPIVRALDQGPDAAGRLTAAFAQPLRSAPIGTSAA
ncbi:tryptophan synthase subunit alpha [Streptomyces meridianus]|uniref:tryptophan synthase n=1 Tax=Streptomyces meridianus TaxID=2938945 RepID=A0ABT0XAY5_9ACTN|nr:tryptophan synthase subunit alpha [Streptomyces meridianus]MCM2579673.1 tryptophan synthase subunit alpha [Streptomyces meridianus]